MKPELLLEKMRAGAPKRIAVAAAHDDAVLKAVTAAYKAGIIVPILCGDIERIDMLARLHNLDISPFEIIETDSDAQAASIAVSLVKSGRASLLMKGILQTADLLRAVLDKENGLRTGGILSHTAVVYSPDRDRTWFLTDGAMVIYPDLATKRQLIDNAVKAVKRLGVETPNVAALAAVELVNPDMPATVDAALLTVMNRRGQISGCVVDGPLAMDLALSEEAARHKNTESPVAGKADILLFPNIEAANAAAKALTGIGGCVMGGVVMGATAPIVLNSRSDPDDAKLYSIAIACSVSD